MTTTNQQNPVLQPDPMDDDAQFEALLAKRKNARLKKVTEVRMHFLTVLTELGEKDIPDSYRHSLLAIVEASGKNGVELASIKEVLPNTEVLQKVRNEVGTGTYVIKRPTGEEETLHGEKWIKEAKGKSKGNTVTLYPGEKMKAQLAQDLPPDPNIKPSTPSATPTTTGGVAA